MLITRTSRITGRVHTLDLPVTQEQLARFERGELAQLAFPELAPPLREFLITGITPEEWEQHVMPLAEEEDPT